MTAYYNEMDPYAAQWLRNLIAAGHIAAGEVDERSIVDVSADELAGFAQCHFFAGIGVWSLALRNAGWPDDRQIWTGSCPCQPFSAAGKQQGFADERHLWPVWFNLISQRRPAVVVGEQVATALDWLDLVSADMEASSYAFAAADLCAAGFGGAHIRQRLYFAGVAQPNGGERERFADGEGCQPNGEATGWEQGDGIAAAGGFVRRLAHSKQPRLEGHAGHGDHSHQPGRLDAEQAGSIAQGGGAGRMANAERDECGQVSPHASGSGSGSGTQGVDERPVNGGDERGRVDDASGARCDGAVEGPEGNSRSEARLRLPREGHGQDRTESAHAPMLGRNPADWLYCRDGKWRPVEPGTFPLVDAAPARVGRLRAYGNALDAETASQFIGAVMECLP